MARFAFVEFEMPPAPRPFCFSLCIRAFNRRARALWILAW